MVHVILKKGYAAVKDALDGRFNLYNSSNSSMLLVDVEGDKVPIVIRPRGSGTMVKVDPIYRGKSSTAKEALKRILKELDEEPVWSNL